MSDTFKLDIKEDEKNYIVEADLPGVAKEENKFPRCKQRGISEGQGTPRGAGNQTQIACRTSCGRRGASGSSVTLVDISVEDGRFTISVNRNEEINDESGGYLHRERRSSSMSRSVYLSGASNDGVGAKLDNGVLTVSIPKITPEDTRRKIEIE